MTKMFENRQMQKIVIGTYRKAKKRKNEESEMRILIVFLRYHNPI